jgi:flavin-dependent thymidylate synthase
MTTSKENDMAIKTSNMSKRGSNDFNIAPGQVGRTDIGYDNLEVNLILWPEEDVVKKVLSKASVAVRGNIVGDEQVDEAMVADMFKGGLNQALEWFTVAFEVSGVSRGVTHQLVRTRKASFSQQSMRYADMGSFNVRMPVAIYESNVQDPVVDENKYPMLTIFDDLVTPEDVWSVAIEMAREAYAWLADHGIPMQDTRTVCPIATETYIICEYPLSEFINTYAYRACSMFYPETVALFRLMGSKLIEKCPWLAPMIKISCEKTFDATHGHKCTYQGWEQVEGQCDFPWALEENRTFKSTKVKQ